MISLQQQVQITDPIIKSHDHAARQQKTLWRGGGAERERIMKYASERRSAGGQISRYGSRDYGGIMKYREQFFYIGKKIVVFLCSHHHQTHQEITISRLTPTDPLQSYYGERVEKMSV